MKKIYYTLEGKPYSLFTISQTVITALAAGVTQPVLLVNYTGGGSGAATQIQLQVNKGIVPIFCLFSIADRLVLGNPLIGTIASPYSMYVSQGVGAQFSWVSTLTKVIEQTHLLYKNTPDDNFAEYGLRYDQIILDDKDFVVPPTNSLFTFFKNLGHALDNAGTTDSGINVPAPIASANVTLSFTYFQFL